MSDDRWAEYFGERRWRVASEVTGTDFEGGATTAFTGGKFTITGDGAVFHSPLSSARGKSGVLLQEVDEQGNDVDGSQLAVGVVVLRKARQAGAIK